MRNETLRQKILLLLPAAFFFLVSGCFYRVNLDSPVSLNIDPREHQPLALIPVPDPPGAPEYGDEITAGIRSCLEEKGYRLIAAGEVSEALEEMELTAVLLLSAPEALPKIAERLRAGLLIIGTVPEYSIKKSYWGAQTLPIWNREAPDGMTLPTYFRGSSRVRLVLRMFEPEGGSMVWMTEGTIRGAGDSAAVYGRKLAERLLDELPPAQHPRK